MAVKQIGLQEKLGKQDFPYDASGLFDPITKTVLYANPKYFEEPKATAKALGNFS